MSLKKCQTNNLKMFYDINFNVDILWNQMLMFFDIFRPTFIVFIGTNFDIALNLIKDIFQLIYFIYLNKTQEIMILPSQSSNFWPYFVQNKLFFNKFSKKKLT